jgi:hypothetical protein
MKVVIPHSNFSRWIWPVPMFMDNPPVISDGYGRDKRGGRGHFGIDVMHARRPIDWAPGTVGSKNFCTYPGEEAMTVADGLVQDVGVTSKGHFVRMTHRVGDEGRPLLSVYRHLRNIRPGIATDNFYPAGTPLGFLGDDPSNPNDPVHLHFELWDISRTRVYPDVTFDPTMVMKLWRVKRVPQGDFIKHPKTPKGYGAGFGRDMKDYWVQKG